MTNVTELLLAVVTSLVLAFGLVAQPDRARCPDGMIVREGVRRNGRFLCRPELLHGDDLSKPVVQPPGEVHGRIYCSSDHIPTISYRGRGVRCWPASGR